MNKGHKMTETQTFSSATEATEAFKTVAFSSVGRVLKSKRVQVAENLKLSYDVHHDKDSKVFRATVTVWDFMDDAWVVVLHTGFRGVAVKAAGRYSEKALRAFFEETFSSGAVAETVAKTLAQKGLA
jgi:hypothetical protein